MNGQTYIKYTVLVWDREKWMALVNAVMKIQVT